MENDSYKVSEVAKKFGVSTETVRRWARSGQLPSIKKKRSSHWLFSKNEIDDMLAQGKRPDETQLTTPNSPVADRDYDLNSDATIPSPAYFVKVVQAIAEFVEKLEDVEVLDGPYDKKRDIIGYYRTRHQKKELVYIQCKKNKSISEAKLKKELDELKAYMEDPKKWPLDKPDKIIFAVSSNVIATIRDTLRAHSKKVLGVPLVFWCPRDLNLKIKSEPKVHKLINPSIDPTPSQLPQVAEVEYRLRKDALYEDQKNEVTKGLIKKSGELIEQGQIQEAKDFLLGLIGKLSVDTPGHKEDLSKAYNNLGLCFTKVHLGQNEVKAIEYFEKALELNAELYKARGNLILALLRSSGDKKKLHFNRSQLLPYIDDETISDDDYFFIAYVLVGSLEALEGADAAVSYMEGLLTNKTVKKRKLNSDEDMLVVLAFLYFRQQNFTKTANIVNGILATNPRHFDALYLDVLVILASSLLSTQQGGYGHDLLPNFEDVEKIEHAYETLGVLVNRAQDEARDEMLEELKHNLFLCETWLRRFGKKDILVPVAEDSSDRSGLVKLSKNIYEKKFDEAWKDYTDLLKENPPTPDDKMRAATVFADYGAPQYAQKIYDDNETVLAQHPMYWLNRSLVEILLGNADLAKEFSFRAKALVGEDEKIKKIVLSHVGAVLLRDPKEGDRILKTTFEMQDAFPEEKILTGYNIDTDKDKIIEIFSKGRERMEGIAKNYQDNAVPSYFLERVMNKTFFECWAGRTYEFPWIVTEQAPAFYQEQIKALKDGKPLILDYEALLSLTQAKLLGYLERLTNDICIDFGLFQKVQQELLKTEHPVLRELWEYLRSSRARFLYTDIELTGDIQKLNDVLDQWLLKTVEYAKQNEVVFVCDDLRLNKSAQNNGVVTANTFGILYYLKSKQLIDKKAYSKKIGQLAKCFYTFIGFDSDDLHEIVWQDDYEVTSGSFHLIRQMHLEGSDPHSFIGVFIGFVAQLWQSGATSEDKVKWLGLLTEETTRYINKQLDLAEKTDKEMKEIISHFVNLWIEAVKATSREEDLNELMQKLDDISGELLANTKQSITAFINSRLKEIKANT